ncbi:hypothetical protein [Actinoplanes campanulatus]|nr:hypothetical protein [Actinoplanes capillaceus]
MVVLAVEFDQFRFEVGADVPHDLFHLGQMLVGERLCRSIVPKVE